MKLYLAEKNWKKIFSAKYYKMAEKKEMVVVKEFNYQTLEKLSLSYDLLNMFTKIREYKGKQALHL